MAQQESRAKYSGMPNCAGGSVIFALRDLAGDAPFSRLDLIGWANVLIYMDRPLQKRIFSIFQYSLKKNGVLCGKFVAAIRNIHT